jgi:nucleoside-diphosphate-sugar epimerase
MRVLVIGGSGFIGTHVVAALRGHEVAVLTRGRAPTTVRAITGDRKRLAESRDAIAAFAPDVVIDMIASSGDAARGLVAAVRGIAKRVVVISSMDVYRACGVLHRLEPGELEPLPLTEDSPLRTVRQTYPPAQLARLAEVFGWLGDGYDKIAVEETVRELGATVLRLPMVYGPGDPLRRLLPIVKRIDDGRPALILAESIASWRASRGYVDNVADAIVLAALDERAAGTTFNISEPDAYSEREWAERVAHLAGFAGEVVVLPDAATPAHLRQPGNSAQHWIASSARIRTLGYRERVPLDEAIRRTIAWERATPITGFVSHAFDAAAEDAALAAR